MRDFLTALLCMSSAAAFAAPALAKPAVAKTDWSIATQPSIEARPSESESDAALRATCSPGLVSLRLGGTHDVGKGKGEPVSVTIESNGKSAKVEGVSRNTPDFEMTGGTELVTDLPLDAAALAILFSGKAVTIVTPGQKKSLLFDADSSGAGKKFLAKCGGG